MQAEKGKVVSIHYIVSEEPGAEIESSHGRDPMAFLIGHGNIIPGLDKAIAGHSTGDKFDVVVAPDEAYGQRREDFVQRVAKKYFRDAEHLKPCSAPRMARVRSRCSRSDRVWSTSI